jgi:hypothetical protein
VRKMKENGPGFSGFFSAVAALSESHRTPAAGA